MIKRFTEQYRFLSNFYPSEVTVRLVNGELAKCPDVEHAYQVLKTTVEEEQRAVLETATPGQAKRAGRNVTMHLDWEVLKVGVMRNLLRTKFASGSELAKQLIATGDEELIEGNDWGDLYWGIDLKTGQGHNTLGRLLMQVRSELVAENVGTATSTPE